MLQILQAMLLGGVREDRSDALLRDPAAARARAQSLVQRATADGPGVEERRQLSEHQQESQ